MAANSNFRKYYGGEKIAFEQEDNIVLVDPNKIINSDGQLQERLVEHENLIMYANLEANIIPRTKLALGENTDQMSSRLTIANFGQTQDGKINFLKPQGKDYFDSSYTDQLTGQNARGGEGINQTQITDTGNRNVRNVQDTQMLGITSINIKNNSSFIPQVDIEMVDVQGRTLFELGENSPYSAFFQLPYPLFYLTVKGFYGKAVKYELMMKSFNARFDPTDGNYKISISFIGRTAALLSDLSLGALYALPHMYETNVLVQENSDGVAETPEQAQSINQSLTTKIQSGIETEAIIPKVRTRGDDVLNKVYQTYISKGLIDETLPRLSLAQLELRLQNLEEFVRQQFNKEDLSVLNDIELYKKTISIYREDITLLRPNRWAGENLDSGKRYVDKEGNIYYLTKKSLNGDLQKQEDTQESLRAKINDYNNRLNTNATFGQDGEYTILGKTKQSAIPIDISSNDIITSLSYDDLDLLKTYMVQLNATPNDAELAAFSASTFVDFNLIKKYYNKDLTVDEDLSNVFYTFGEISDSSKFKIGSFFNKLNLIEKQFTDTSEIIQKELSAALAQKIESPDGGLGFRPTIKNVMAMLIANVDAFYRLMDEVHREAWNLKDDPIRKSVIISPETANGVDSKDSVLGSTGEENFIYPWPQYFEREVDGKNVRDVVKYLGDPSCEGRTRAYLYDKWPEVEFVEQFIRGDLQRREEQKTLNYRNSRETIPSISVNAVEYPYNIVPYTNLSEVNFLYELWERTYLASNYTKLFRRPKSSLNMSQVVGEFEATTIIEAIKGDPFLSKKLKNYGLNASNFESVLRSISNEGQGPSWGKFVSDVFVTPYIQEYENNFQKIYSLETYYADSPKATIAAEIQKNLREYLKSTTNNPLTFTDVYPLTNLSWLRANIQKGAGIASANKANETTKTYFFVDYKKALASFDPATVESKDFSYTPTMLTKWYNYDSPPIQLPSKETIKQRYLDKVDKNEFFVSEGVIDYTGNYSGYVDNPVQTTSLLNTPFFINAIDDSVTKRKNGIENPYVSLGYMFINSLPLQTLREKMNSGKKDEPFSDYNFAVYNKFAALHKLPYAWVVKYGSIWHRYKKYVQTQTDILDGVWESIDEDNLFDPVTSQKTTSYKIPAGTGFTNVSLDNTNTNAFGNVIQRVNVGFYPKLVNDVNYLFSYQEIITGYTQSDFTNYSQGNTALGGNGLKVYTNSLSNFNFIPGTIVGDPSKSVSVVNNYTFYDSPLLNETESVDKVICYPSAGGGDFNQYRFEVTDANNNVKTPLRQSLYDGSVKTLWGVSHYGYFDASAIGRPDYYEYVKAIDTNKEEQHSFDLLSTFEYSSIEEIFAVFSEEVLDMFESEFLTFCKDPNRDRVESEYPFLLDVLKTLFFVDRPTLVGNGELDGKSIALSQKESFKRGVQKLFDSKVIYKQGNPSYYDRRVWNSFSDDTTYQPNQKIDFGSYIPNTLPTSGGTISLAASQANNLQAWEALQLSVGRYLATGYDYSSNGSVITDFFVDMDIEFNESNVRQLSHIIKIYASQKFENPSMTASQFMNNFNDYLSLLNTSQQDIQNVLFRQLNQDLPSIIQDEDKIESSMKGDVVKLELYEFFKTLNDKWIAGGDFQERTIFEDFLFLDRANRNIGDKLIVNVDGLRKFLSARNGRNSVYTLIGHLIKDNNMLFMALPSYTNFYGVSEPSPGATPREGIEDSASSVFGTFAEVDYLDNRPKFVCLYTDRVSEHLNMESNIDYRYGNDGVDFFKDPALKEEQTDKDDYAFSNKVVAFNVDFGVRNQGIFQSVSLDQSQFKDTSESFLITTDMANQAKGSKTFQQSTSLYNIYKNRSYNCQVLSMGNVMIQPTMYFNLRYVPMFSGPYWILDVNHSITPGNFTTTFSGVRMSKYSFPDVKDLVMSVNLDILKQLNDTYRREQQATESSQNESEVNTNTGQTSNGISGQQTEVSQTFCTPLQQYENLPYVSLRTETLAYSEIKSYADALSLSNLNVRRLIGLIPWVENTINNGQITFNNGNLGNLITEKILRGITNNDIEGQVCVNVDNQNKPLASFADWKTSMEVIKTILTTSSVYNDMTQIGSSEYENESEKLYAKIYIKYYYSQIGSDADFNRIITNPSNDDERQIQSRYNQVVPLFKKGINWYIGSI